MVAFEALKPTARLLVMDLVAEAGLDVGDWANYAGKHPASNPRYCYDWVFTQAGKPSVACLWFGNLERGPDGTVQQRLNLWKIARKHESVAGRSAVAKRARALDMALQAAFRSKSPIRVIVVDGEQADLVAQDARSSRVARRMLDAAAWNVSEYDWSTGDCLLVRGDAIPGVATPSPAPVDAAGAPPARSPPLSADDYRRALDGIAMSDDQRRWLVAHYYSPGATISMGQLASALGYSGHRAANGAYGALAHKVADALPRPPGDLEGGEYVDWLQALARIAERDASNHSQWRLRDEVVQAMLDMGWVEARDGSDGEATESPTPEERQSARDYGLDDTQVREMMLSRRGQGRFRSETLRFWGGRCAVSGLPESCFLVASHIKPWKDANPNERLDGFNGLPLTPNLDRAFDRGYVSFAEDGSILISPAMSAESMQALGIRRDMALRICDRRTGGYLAYHREHVFIR